MQTKHCIECDTTKPLSEFTQTKPKDHYKAQPSYHTYCKACNALRAKQWRKDNGSSYRGSGKVKSIPAEDRLLMSAIRSRVSDAKQRCKKLGKPEPSITAEYLYEVFKNQDRKCALTRADLVIEKEHPLCLSLDQIEPSKGYVEGNVQWLAWAVNRAKGDLDLIDFIGMCESVLEYRKEQRLSNGSVS